MLWAGLLSGRSRVGIAPGAPYISRNAPACRLPNIKSHNRRAQSSRIRRRVRPIQNEIRLPENTAHNFTLHADSFAVNDAHNAQMLQPSLAQVFFDDGFDLSRRDRVQIEHVRDFDHDGFGKWVVVF